MSIVLKDDRIYVLCRCGERQSNTNELCLHSVMAALWLYGRLCVQATDPTGLIFLCCLAALYSFSYGEYFRTDWPSLEDMLGGLVSKIQI